MSNPLLRRTNGGARALSYGGILIFLLGTESPRPRPVTNSSNLIVAVLHLRRLDQDRKGLSQECIRESARAVAEGLVQRFLNRPPEKNAISLAQPRRAEPRHIHLPFLEELNELVPSLRILKNSLARKNLNDEAVGQVRPIVH